MVLALAQVTESSNDYDSATIALFVLFIVSMTVTAGLLLRELLFPDQETADSHRPWTPVEPEPVSRQHAGEPPWRPHEPARSSPANPRLAAARNTPAWFNQAVSSQRAGALIGISATMERLVDAANRGDLRAGFACYTPEHLTHYQREHDTDAASLERLSRLEPVPAERRISIQGIHDVTIAPPYRAYATVDYAIEEGERPPSERIRFFYDQNSETWLVDEIEQISG